MQFARIGVWLGSILAGSLALHSPAFAQPCGPNGGWLGVDDGGVSSRIEALAVMPNGDVIAGGGFNSAGGVPVNGIARWNGFTWSAVGKLLPTTTVRAFAFAPNGDLIAVGFLPGLGNVARWDGHSWTPVGVGFEPDQVYTVAVMPNGDVIIGGGFASVPGAPGNSRGLARWDGVAWSSLGHVAGAVNALAVRPNGELIAGGGFSTIGGVSARNIARLNGATWAPLELGTLGSVQALAVLTDGSVVAGGMFERLGNGTTCNYIARWNGNVWNTLGGGANNDVFALTAMPGGGLVAGGRFTRAGNVGLAFVARWNGSAWSALGTGTDQFVFSLAVLPSSRSSEIIVGGQFETAGGRPSRSFGHFTMTGVPWIASPPRSVTGACRGTSTSFSIAAAGGYPNLSYQWRRNSVTIEDGATAAGSMIDGATTPTLTITDTTLADAGSYTCIVTNLCGFRISEAASLTVCAADFDCDGSVRSTDFFEFLVAFFGNAAEADIDANGTITAADFHEFLAAFFAGC